MYNGCPKWFMVDVCTAFGHPLVFEDIESYFWTFVGLAVPDFHLYNDNDLRQIWVTK